MIHSNDALYPGERLFLACGVLRRGWVAQWELKRDWGELAQLAEASARDRRISRMVTEDAAFALMGESP